MEGRGCISEHIQVFTSVDLDDAGHHRHRPGCTSAYNLHKCIYDNDRFPDVKGSRELERRLELAGEGFEVMDDVLWDVGPLFRPLMIVFFKLHQIQGSIPHPLIFLSQVSGHPLPTGTPSRTALMILRSY